MRFNLPLRQNSVSMRYKMVPRAIAAGGDGGLSDGGENEGRTAG